MTVLDPKALSTNSVSWDSHQEHAARLIRLEEFQENHKSEHEKHVATREMVADVRTLVYKIAGALVLAIAGLSVARGIIGF
ncbi:MAG: hypothetical protein OXI48_08355 [bacterium]|nr:hypothetical protein [bacterium]